MPSPLRIAALLALLHAPVHAQASFASLARRVNELTAAADTARTPARRAELSLLRLQTLQRALDAHAAEQARRTGTAPGWESRPLRDGRIRADTSEIVYGEPQGQWYVRDARFWALHARFRALPVAERIAWAAASQDLPGECEGDVTCVFTVAEMTMGRYLALHPAGAHAPAALRELRPMLEFVESETRPRGTHARFCRADGAEGTVTPVRLRAMRASVLRSAGAGRDAAARLLATLAARCR